MVSFVNVPVPERRGLRTILAAALTVSVLREQLGVVLNFSNDIEEKV